MLKEQSLPREIVLRSDRQHFFDNLLDKPDADQKNFRGIAASRGSNDAFRNHAPVICLNSARPLSSTRCTRSYAKPGKSRVLRGRTSGCHSSGMCHLDSLPSCAGIRASANNQRAELCQRREPLRDLEQSSPRPAIAHLKSPYSEICFATLTLASLRLNEHRRSSPCAMLTNIYL
jgi:hypothetical protein